MRTKLKSSPNQGLLVMASTHLGCLEDTPKRTLDYLRSADLVIFEEVKPARALLKSAGVSRPFELFNEHHQQETLEELRTTLKDKKVAVYTSDQGCPGLADPGHALAAIAFEVGAKVLTIPGPSSITAAIAALPTALKNFYFAGFLPKAAADRKKELKRLSQLSCSIVIMDTPYRLKNLLESCQEVFGPKQRAFLSLDISGPEEQHMNGSLQQIRNRCQTIKKLNFVLVLIKLT